MATNRPQGDDKRRQRRELIVFLLILLMGFGCLLFAAQMAIWPGAWRAEIGMGPGWDPDEGLGTWESYIQPIRPAIMTPPSWMNETMTPGTPVIVSPAVFGASSTGTPQEVVEITPSATPTRRRPTRTSRPTSTSTPTPSPTSSATYTPTPTGTATPTSTPTRTPSPVPPPPTNTPPVPTSTPSPTSTPPPSPTALPPVVQGITPHTEVNTDTVGVTITGLNFQSGCSAHLGSLPLTVSSCAPTVVTGSVPKDLVAGYYDLTVINPDSQSDTLTGVYTATNPIPVISSVTPMTWFNTLDTYVVIAGSHFCDDGSPGSLQAALDGTLLSDVSWVSTTTLTARAPSASMAMGSYTLSVTNPGPTAPSGSLTNAFVIDTYTTTVTCSGAVMGDCNDAGGPPDGTTVGISTTGVITLDFGLGEGITHGSGPDMVFYERANAPGILLDFVRIELSADGATWYNVFEWDGDNPGDVSGTNIDGYATDGDGELANEPIPSSVLYPYLGTGVTIDISGMTGASTGPFHLVRLTYPGPSDPALDEVGEIDAVQPLHQ